MKVLVLDYPTRRYEDLGAERFEVEWIETKDGRRDKPEEDFDPDVDTVTHCLYFKTRTAALKHAKEIFDDRGEFLTWGVVTVTRQAVEFFDEDHGYAEWRNVGDAEEISK